MATQARCKTLEEVYRENPTSPKERASIFRSNAEFKVAFEQASSSYTHKSRDQLAEMVEQCVLPAYPPLAKAARVNGTVWAEVRVDERGKVMAAGAARGHPLLKDAVTEAAYHWKFHGATKDGLTARAFGLIGVTFKDGRVTRTTPPRRWYALESAEGGFRVTMPMQPEIEQQQFAVGNAQVIMHAYSGHTVENGFFASYYDIMGPFDLQASIQGTADHMTHTYGGEVEEITKVSRQGCQGFESVVSGGSATVRIRAFKAGKRVFNLMCVQFDSGSDDADDPVADFDFFESFDIKGGCTEELEPDELLRKPTKSSSVGGPLDIATGWERITISEDRFSFLAPTDAAVFEEDVDTGTFTTRSRSYSSTANDMYFGALVFVFPDQVSKELNSQILIGSLIRRVQQAFNQYEFTLQPPHEARLGEFTCKEYVITRRDGSIIGALRAVIASGRAYGFLAFGPQSAESTGAIDRFFSSVKIVP